MKIALLVCAMALSGCASIDTLKVCALDHERDEHYLQTEREYRGPEHCLVGMRVEI